MGKAITYTDNQYAQTLINDREKKLNDNYKKARAYLKGQNYYDLTLEEKVSFMLTENGLVLIEAMSGQKMPIITMADILAVTQTVFHNIMRDNPEIYDAVDRGRLKDIDEVEKSLFKIAKGYKVTETRNKIYPNERNGTTSVITENIEREIAPNYNAATYILNNKRNQEYRDKQIEYELAKNTIKVEVEIIGDETLNLE